MKKLTSIFLSTFLFLFVSINAQDLDIKWIEVQGGTFKMGIGNDTKQVTLSNFFISATEITFEQYDIYCEATEVYKPNDNGWGRGKRPVLNVSYDDAVNFCKWMSKKSNGEIRLPNEAEWEYAAIGGRKSKGYTFSGSNNWEDVSWSESNSGNKTQPVGKKKPNELKIYDMSGNLWEWCADFSGSSGNKNGKSIKRALRGNSFDNPASTHLSPSLRLEGDSRHINIGFRIVKTK